MKNRVFGFCFIALVYVSFNNTGYAQRPITGPTTMGCWRQPITPISEIPTLHSDMPFDCILGYIYFDSLCRGLGPWPQSYNRLDSMIALMGSWDTMRVFMRFMYKMEEYNADLYVEYEEAAPYLAPSYSVLPMAVENKLIHEMRQVLGSQNKLAYLTMVPVILHIRVVDTETSYDSLCAQPIWPQPRMCVHALVIDTIKGMHLRPGDDDYLIASGKGKVPLNDTLSWINIDYSPVSTKPYVRGEFGIDVVGAFHCDSCYGASALIPGKDYIVFLDDGFLDYNGTNSFYEYVPYNGFNNEGGIFPIDPSGNVISPANYFGYGTSTPLPIFETDLRTDILSIISH